jgi:hypothetical protein
MATAATKIKTEMSTNNSTPDIDLSSWFQSEKTFFP